MSIDLPKTIAMKKLTLLFPLLAAVSICSCSNSKGLTVERKPLFKDGKGAGAKLEPTLFFSRYDANHRGSLFITDDQGRLKVLSENPPDAAVERSLSLLAEGKLANGASGNVKLETMQSVLQLGQRTAAVNILRDALYRLSEMCHNSNSGVATDMSDDVKEVIIKTLETCEKVSIALASETDAIKRAESVNALKEMVLSLPAEQRSQELMDKVLLLAR